MHPGQKSGNQKYLNPGFTSLIQDKSKKTGKQEAQKGSCLELNPRQMATASRITGKGNYLMNTRNSVHGFLFVVCYFFFLNILLFQFSPMKFCCFGFYSQFHKTKTFSCPRQIGQQVEEQTEIDRIQYGECVGDFVPLPPQIIMENPVE